MARRSPWSSCIWRPPAVRGSGTSCLAVPCRFSVRRCIGCTAPALAPRLGPITAGSLSGWSRPASVAGPRPRSTRLSTCRGLAAAAMRGSWSDMSRTVEYRYIGPVQRITTVLDGRPRALSFGDVVEVSPRQAEQLDLQPVNWQKVVKKTAAEDAGNSGSRSAYYPKEGDV